MPSADKRARKKENTRAAREAREAALRRKKRTRSTITVAVVVALFVGVIVLLNVTGGSDKKKPAAAGTSSTTATPTTLDPGKTYTATIKTNLGVIKLEMNVKDAPIAASHFVELARKGVYDGSRWHRVIKGFVIQGGAPGGDPTKTYGKPVAGEVPKRSYAVGDVAAAKTGTDPSGTFDSQFFIVTGAKGVALSRDYADFARVTSGMDVVRKIEALKTGPGDDPTQKATIDKITVSES
jgi:peptidyl-prolyl cis-trans isomerase B (cyclophilin B)